MYVVYVIGPHGGPYKIGHTNDVHHRLLILNIGHPDELYIQAARAADDRSAARWIERAAHAQLRKHHIRGEWFNCDLEEARLAIRVKYVKQTPKSELEKMLIEFSKGKYSATIEPQFNANGNNTSVWMRRHS